MLGRFFKDSSIYAVAGTISQGIALLLFPFLAHVLHPREYGALDILILIGIIVNLTVALEVSQGLGRYLHDARDEKDRKLYTSTAVIFTLGCFALFTLVVVIFAGPLSHAFLGRKFGPGLLRLAAMTWFVNGILYITCDQLRWRLRPKAFAAVTVAVGGATTAASAIFVLGLHDGVAGAIGGQLVGVICGLLLTALLSRDIYSLAFDWTKCRTMLSFSIPLIPGSIGVFLNGYADRVAIQHEASLSQVGVYGIGYRFAVVVGLVLVGFQGAVVPLVLANQGNPEIQQGLGRVFRLFCMLALATFMLVSVLAGPAVRILAAPSYYTAAGIVPYVVAATLLGGMGIFAPGPLLAQRTVTIAGIWVTAGLLNAGLAFALVSPLGLTGAGIATLLSSGVSFIALMVVSQRHYPVPHSWGRVLCATSMAAGLVAFTNNAIPSDFGSALDPALLALRTCLVICAVGALPWLLLNADERAKGWRAVQTKLHLRSVSSLASSESAQL